MNKILSKTFFIYLLLALSFKIYSEELKQYRGLIHIHSNFSSGEQNLSDIIETAKSNGIQYIILGDNAVSAITYGIEPFRNLLDFTHKENAVLSVGIDKYFDEIDILIQKNSSITIIPGIEYSPFYYWDGSILDGSLTLKDWDKQLLVVGLPDNKNLFEELPILNGKISKRNLKYYFPTFFVFLLSLAISLPIILSKTKYRYVAIGTSIISILGVANNLPFKSTKYNPYSGNRGSKPFQEFINHTNNSGLLSFWTHIESSDESSGNSITEKFPIINVANGAVKHSSVLIETNGYTGFEAFLKDNIPATNPGKEWDQELLSYIRRENAYPAWAIGGYGCKSSKKNGGEDPFDSIQTIVMAVDANQSSILSALLAGKNYSLYKSAGKNLILEEFGLKSISGKLGLSGDTVTVPLQPEIFIALSMEDLGAQPFDVTLIRSGKIATELKCDTPCKLSYVEEIEVEEAGFYRIIVKGKETTLLSNPIFFFPEK